MNFNSLKILNILLKKGSEHSFDFSKINLCRKFANKSRILLIACTLSTVALPSYASVAPCAMPSNHELKDLFVSIIHASPEGSGIGNENPGCSLQMRPIYQLNKLNYMDTSGKNSVIGHYRIYMRTENNRGNTSTSLVLTDNEFKKTNGKEDKTNIIAVYDYNKPDSNFVETILEMEYAQYLEQANYMRMWGLENSAPKSKDAFFSERRTELMAMIKSKGGLNISDIYSPFSKENMPQVSNQQKAALSQKMLDEMKPRDREMEQKIINGLGSNKLFSLPSKPKDNENDQSAQKKM